jgi:hypothetical protein
MEAAARKEDLESYRSMVEACRSAYADSARALCELR